jgi:hypothetical protein
MPIKKRIHRVVQPSDRVLRPLAGRKLSVDQTFDFIEELVRLEEEDTEPNMSGAGPAPDPPPPPPQPQIDPMMLPRGLPILVPHVPQLTIPANLPKFSGSRNEDPAAHVERFEELLISSLVTRREYYLIWFPTTLTDSAYSWYRSHDAGTFLTWDQLQAAFLNQYRPEIGQQQALSALTNTRQGQTEDITAYVRRFKVVCTRYVGTLLNDETIRYYFIQGFDRNSTRREVLARRPRTLEDAIRVALEVEIVDKESDRMEKRFDDPIPSFIPLTHRPSEPLLDHHSSEEFRPNHQDLQRRAPQQVPPAWDEVKKEIQYATKGMKDEFMRNMQSLNEQMAMLVRTHKSVPSYYESGPHTSGLWCTNVGCPDPVGHTS